MIWWRMFDSTLFLLSLIIHFLRFWLLLLFWLWTCVSERADHFIRLRCEFNQCEWYDSIHGTRKWVYRHCFIWGWVWVQYQTKMLINPIEWWDFFFSAVPVGMLLVSLAVFHCAWCQKKQCDQHVLYRLTHAFDGTMVIRFPGENLFIESVNRFSRINDTHTAHGSHASAHNHRFSDGFGEQLLSRCDVV